MACNKSFPQSPCLTASTNTALSIRIKHKTFGTALIQSSFLSQKMDSIQIFRSPLPSAFPQAKEPSLPQALPKAPVPSFTNLLIARDIPKSAKFKIACIGPKMQFVFLKSDKTRTSFEHKEFHRLIFKQICPNNGFKVGNSPRAFAIKI